MIFPSKAQMWKGDWIFILNFKLYCRRAARLKKVLVHVEKHSKIKFGLMLKKNLSCLQSVLLIFYFVVSNGKPYKTFEGLHSFY